MPPWHDQQMATSHRIQWFKHHNRCVQHGIPLTQNLGRDRTERTIIFLLHLQPLSFECFGSPSNTQIATLVQVLKRSVLELRATRLETTTLISWPQNDNITFGNTIFPSVLF